ncbi:hypothetical protein KIK84_14085 [Curvibacter sp. CHRR-16]|uniref:hypothetical protein n=1 Tax=Curvibacter sp. CHRR-16 TaxID=2835872 RepID=UPI001BDACA05|nr:hypothetical protein [Curvibacter sp. CHRR-16]MBT0571454.1 hypothetical protein [Curvibacter sp. CHRR-16]
MIESASSPSTPVQHSAATERADRILELTQQLLPVWHRHIASVRRHSDEAVSNMLVAFAEFQRQVSDHCQQLGQNMPTAMQGSSHQLLEAFQYQDRLSQRLALLEQDITRLVEQLQDAHAPPPDANAWLARLRGEYAMNDQHNDHSNHAVDGANNGTQDPHFF